MSTQQIFARLLAVCLAAILFVPLARAQDAEDEAPAAEAKAKKPPAKPGRDAQAPQFESPAVRSVLESNPSTPAELLQAVDVLADLDRTALARPLLAKLIAAQLDQETLTALVREFGSPIFLKLSRNEQLAPEGKQFADAALTAAAKFNRDPKRLAQRAAQLADADKVVRQDAAIELMRAHSAAVGPVLRVLANPKQAAGHKLARSVLVELGSDAIGPLLGVLESSDAALTLQAIGVLEAIGDTTSVPYLLAPAVSDAADPRIKAAAQRALRTIAGSAATKDEAPLLLAGEVRKQLTRSRLAAADADASVELWQWDAKQKQSVPTNYRPDEAAALTAARLAADLHAVGPKSGPNNRLYLVALLEGATFQSGFDKPLPTADGTPLAIAAKQSPGVVEEVLADALAGGYHGAAAAAAQILGDVGSPQMLHTAGSSPSPLAQAARSSDRRVRFAAMQAILKLKPTEPFVGSSAVAESLGYFASSAGVRKALVAHPRTDQGQQLAALLAQLGFEADVATSARQAMELAGASPDYEVVLIHLALPQPGAEDLAKQLRREPRTARLPIGLIATPRDPAGAERLVDRAGPGPAENTFAVATSDDPATLKPQIEGPLARAGRSLVSVEERKRQAAAAIDSIIALSSTPQTVFDLQRQIKAVERALFVPELTAKAATALGNLGTAQGQRALIEVASRGSLAMPARESAAAALRNSVGRFGILLTSGEILKQYDNYNASANADEATQQLLASILDTLEKKVANQR